MKFYYLIISAILCTSCSASDQIIVVENNLDFDRKSEIVEIPLSELKAKFSGDRTFVVKNSSDEIMTSQITFDRKLIFQAGVRANGAESYTILTGDKINFEPKVAGRAHPERYDDFAWENDKVGFRFYGNSLKSVDGPSNGLDLWYKRTNNIVLDKWYEKNISGEASYHVDHGEGCDPYAVGRTLGAGNMAPFINDSLWLNENYLTAEVLDNGPLRITFKLTYPEMEIDGKKISERKTISLDAGSQLTKVTQEFVTEKAIKVAAGIVKRAQNDSILTSPKDNYFIYQDPMTEKNGQVYVGVLIPQGIDSVFANSYTYKHIISGNIGTFSNVLATTDYQPNQPIIYYTGFGWSKFGFETIESFETYMQQYSLKIKQPLIINFK